MNWDKTLRYSIISGLILLLATPFIISSSLYFPFITGKAFFFRVIVSIIFVLWVILAVKNKEYRPKKNLLLLSFSLFVVSILISNIFGANFENSMFSRLERMEGFITIANLYGLFLVASSIMREKINWDVLFNASVVASIFMAFYGFFQLAGKIVINQGSRLDGTLGNSIYLAVYILFNIFITINLFYRKPKNLTLRIFYVIALILQTITIYHTATRGAMFGLIGGIFIIIIFALIFNRKNKRVKKYAITTLVTILIIIVGAYFARHTDFVQSSQSLSRFTNFSLSEQTISARFMIWDSAWKGFKDHPILGWGQGNFSYPFSTYYSADQYAQEPWFDRTHNVVFDWLIAGGLIGLVLYLSLFGSSLYLLWFKESNFSNTEKSILTGLLSAYGFHSLSVFDNVVSYIYFILILAYISSQTKSDILFKNISTRVGYVIVIFALVLIPWQLYAFNYPTYKQAKGIISASIIFTKNSEGKFVYRLPGGPLENLQIYKEVFEYDAGGNREAIQNLVQVAGQFARNQNVPIEIRNEFLQFTSSKLTEFQNRDPKQALYYDLSSRFHGSLGILDRSLTDIDKAIELSPNKQSFYNVKSQILFLLKRQDEALEVAKYSYNLQKKNDEAWSVYIKIALDSGNKDLVESLIADSLDIGKDLRVQEFLDEIKKNNPDNK